MPNNSILGGSPLGLITVRSYMGSDGRSTFNADESRNVDVRKYNANEKNVGLVYGNSLFSGYRTVRAWPILDKKDPSGLSDVYYENKKYEDKSKPKSGKGQLHNDSIYDTSILNIVEKLSGTKAQLRPSDFVYLKNLGVYPNNRLVVVRRFASPVDDNIMTKKESSELSSLATLITWVPEDQDFLSISFGEKWTPAEADFTAILNELGKDFGLDNLGGGLAGGANLLPMQGFTEIFQRKFLQKIGLMDSKADKIIPSGDPNLIKEAKRRSLVGYNEAGSGLACTVSFELVFEYEMKYISGIDPTIVWMDLISMITRFGTSSSDTYGLSKKAGNKFKGWLNNPESLLKEIIDGVKNALNDMEDEVTKKIQDNINKMVEKFESDTSSTSGTAETAGTGESKPKADIKKEELDKKKEELDKQKTEIIGNFTKGVKNLIQNGLTAEIKKYRIKIIGVINSLTGLSSTPWHITIGNPLRPIFCSGDMYTDSVTLKLGPTLAFNDLPSNITVSFKLTNARPWGMQEIMAKFNTGYLRTIDTQKTYYEAKSEQGEYTGSLAGYETVVKVVSGSASTVSK